MAKTLDEIISRTDYEKLNAALTDRAIDIAVKIRKKMVDLDLKELESNGITIEIKEVRSNSGFSTDFLAIISYDCENGYARCHSLEETSSYYFANDFNCWIQRATSKEFLDFLNTSRSILDTLDEIETEKCDAITKALEETKDI